LRHYLDSSALVKLLITEDGSDLLDQVFDTASELHSCRIAYPETRAAIAAAWRSSRLDDAGHHRVRVVLDSMIWPELDIVEVTPSLAATAGDLAETWSLRGFDALHFAAALEVAGPDASMVTWDRRLWRAAQAVGLRVLPADLPGA
jgi:predicted nucleic acid-binding protein